MKFVFSKQYYADIGLHVFPIVKYQKIYHELTSSHHLPDELFVTPEPATRDELLLVHTEDYLKDLEHLRWSERTLASELPLTREIVDMFKLSCGGTILAARLAVQEGCVVHIGGGFHHAFAGKAEGFCYLNDLAAAARVLQKENLARRIAIIDCDLHQGNGTAVIFQNDASVFTFSIHQRDLYPVKERSDLDIHLPIHTSDQVYMNYLHEAIPQIMEDFAPDFVLYQAGADPYEDDQLGSLSLTIAGLEARDRFVLESMKKNGIPVAVTLGGGYAYKTQDTVQIHVNTCLAALRIYSGMQDGKH